MRAVAYWAPGELRRVDLPEPRVEAPDDAVVEVRRTAVCGTDLHLVGDGHGLTPGTVTGHELVGTVREVGPGVRRVRPGQRVVAADFTACGLCWWCRRGDHWECHERRFMGTGTAFGPALAGCHAELVRVPHADVVLAPVPDEVPDDAAVFVGDALATAYAATRRARFLPGDVVAVLGGGPVGQLCAQVAQALGAGVVVLVEPLAARRNLAEACGVPAVEPAAAADAVRRLTDGRGADAVLDAVGGPALLDAALELLRPRGTLCSVGVPGDRSWSPSLARLFADEITLSFAVGDAMRDADALFGLLRGGQVDPLPLVTATVPLGDLPAAFGVAASRSGVKTLVRPDG
ncbi:alcohol dehydrogenase catalytic domain-containing protein [Kineosporia sp. A_224]|uniref:alcohol dehydrogenase catalytic domain-containing protein n=1 Tax=Kineosporia sp. A_224 TaxID=1962180 RepID=UPI000B4AA77D|nr:alcohol dehydrogenase catalytic domain-containing protein [Kineosporia sp. A_224]